MKSCFSVSISSSEFFGDLSRLCRVVTEVLPELKNFNSLFIKNMNVPTVRSSFRRKKGTSKSKRSFSSRKRSHNRTDTMVNRASIRDHTIVADRMLTKVSCSYSGYIPAATGPGQFIVYGNSMYEPFTTPSKSINGLVTGTNGSNEAQPPVGYGTLSALYNQYRVRSSSIKVTVQSENLSDNPVLVVFPVVGLYSSGTGGIVDTQNQRYAVWKQCSCSNNTAQNTVSCYISSAKALGMTKQQYDDYPATAFGGAPTTNLDWYWQVAIYNPLSGDFTAQVIVTVDIGYYIELSDPIPLTN